MIIYINCPKCDDEFEFDIHIHCDRAMTIENETQHCSCPFTEEEMDDLRIRGQAFTKANEV